ncbi:hypothetical protein [Ferrimonas marina]|uniref:Phage shock protein B n=1 Tax=Ferrimonas marina TaxID=299255 RepID=A0A1M5X0P4_9GAMM|nr:hypothetical protein [Ferrimonas marina]SHH93361.1 hypothetical protein SAMN02745129_3131 [Ferrimonas marina]
MELFHAYWWLIFPIGGMVFAGLMAGLDYRHKERMAQLKGGTDQMQQQLDSLTEQNRQLAERVAVLERLATEESTALNAEIRKLV